MTSSLSWTLVMMESSPPVTPFSNVFNRSEFSPSTKETFESTTLATACMAASHRDRRDLKSTES